MIEIGRYTYGYENILTKGDLSDAYIGAFCSIGLNVKIYLGDNHRSDWVTTYPFGYRERGGIPKLQWRRASSVKGRRGN